MQLSLYGGYSSRVYAIPIDVEVEKPVPRAQGPQAILCTDNRTRVSGSYCALVHDDTGQNYLLTCHHVAALSLQDLSSHRVPTFSYIEDLLAGITAGAHLADQFGPDIDFAIDAALIQILDPAVLEELLSPSRWHVPVVDYVRSEAELMDMSDRRMNLLSRHRRRLPCRLKTMYQNKEVAYGARGVRTRIFQLAEFTLTTADTAAGYSGGGVVATDGTLLAMHIAGVGNISYAIPAYLLIDSGLLRTPVALGPV